MGESKTTTQERLLQKYYGRLRVTCLRSKLTGHPSRSRRKQERGIEHLPVYCASRGGVDTLAKQLAVEYGPHNVNVDTAMGRQIETVDVVPHAVA